MADASSKAGQTRRLTTHVLDTASGRPAEGVGIEVYRLEGAAFAPVAEARTNADGRCDEPLLSGPGFVSGEYEIRFGAGSYFQHRTPPVASFLSIVPVRFTVGDDVAHIHVPLLISPFGYSTYRGS